MCVDGIVSSVVRRRFSHHSRGHRPAAIHLANNDLEWRGERPRSEGLSVGSY